ncbi:MAG: ion transporter, partial [Oceanococcaceae bacterium]
MSTRLQQFLAARWIQYLIIGLILLNALTLGLETSHSLMERWGTWVKLADRIILALFTLEVLAKLLAWKLRFWRDPWNVFDFAVVAVALVPSSGPIAVLRVLRLLRLVPGMLSIFGLLLLVFYVFAIIATSLFGQTHPDWFGSLGASLYSLFQIMTLESWSMGIARPVMAVHPWAWAFFVPFILVSTFTVL